MKDDLHLLRSRIQNLQMDVHQVMAGIPNSVTSEEIPALVDSGFLCRELANIAEDIKKIAENRQAIIARFLVARASVAALQGEVIDLSGELATGSPVIKQKPKLPEQGTEDWVKLMRWIGVSDDLIQKDMLRPSFSRITEVLTERAERGEKPPPGILNTFTDAQVVFRRKKT